MKEQLRRKALPGHAVEQGAENLAVEHIEQVMEAFRGGTVSKMEDINTQ